MENIRLFELEADHMAAKESYEYPTVTYTEDTNKVHWMTNNKVIMDFEISDDDVLDFNGERITIMENASIYDSLKVDGVEQAQPLEEKTITSQLGYMLSSESGGGASPMSLSDESSELPKVVDIHPDNWIGGYGEFVLDYITLNFSKEIKSSYALIVYASPWYVAEPKKYDFMAVYRIYGIDELGEISDNNKSITINETLLTDWNENIISYWNKMCFKMCFAVIDSDYVLGGNGARDAYFVDNENAIVDFTIETNWPTLEDELTVKNVTNANSVTASDISVDGELIQNATIVKALDCNQVSPYSVPTLKLTSPVTWDAKVLIYDGLSYYTEALSDGYITLSEDKLEIQVYHRCKNVYLLNENCGLMKEAIADDGIDSPVAYFPNSTSPLMDCEVYYKEPQTRESNSSVLNSDKNSWIYDPTQTKQGIDEVSWLAEPWKGDMILTFESPITENDTVVIAVREDGNNDWIYTRNYNYKNDSWSFNEYFEALDETYTKFKLLQSPSNFDIDGSGYYEITIYGVMNCSDNSGSSGPASIVPFTNSGSDSSCDLTNDNFIECAMTSKFGGVNDVITLPSTESKIYRVIGCIRRDIDNMDYMFSGYDRMINIDLRRVNTSNVTSMSRMFASCIRLTSLDLSSFDTSKVTNMHDMFFSCASLTSLNLSNFDTSNVTYMRSMFSRCTSLTSLDLSNFDTSNVTNMSVMFEGCRGLTSLDLSSFDISKVTNVTGLCSGCTSLTSVTFGEKFDTSNVTDMDYMFSGCYSLTSLDLSSFDTSNVTRMNYMFSGCYSLTSLDLSSFDISKVTNMNYMFSGCSGITTLKYFKKTKSSVGNIKTQLGLSALTSITSIDFSGWDTSNVTNMSGLCSGCTSLISITFGDTFNTSNVTDMNSMFSVCSGLTSLDLSSFDTSNVTNMKSMFSGCYSLTSLDLSSFVTSNVTSMQSMFNGCSGLTSLDLSNFDTSKVTTMSGMFGACTGLTSIDLSGWDTNNVIYMGEMFASCQSLTSMTQVIGFDKLNTSKLTSMHGMFYYCTNLTSIDLSSFDTRNVTSMYNMFGLCKSLTSITFGSQADVSKVTSYNEMFRFITTTGTLYYPSAYANAWNKITNQSTSYFPSTWAATAVDY